MALVRTKGILLRKRDYSETSLVAVFFTEDFGKVQFIVKGAKRKKGSFFGSFEHCSCYEILFQHRSGQRGLTVLREAHLVEGFPEIRNSLERLYHASYCIELVDALTEVEDPDPALFQLMFETLSRIRFEKDLELRARIFETKFLIVLGLLGDISVCSGCQNTFQDKIYLNPRTARLFCEKCSKREALPFRQKDLKWISDLRKGEAHEVSPKARSSIRKLLWFYIDFHLGKSLKSRRFLSSSSA